MATYVIALFLYGHIRIGSIYLHDDFVNVMPLFVKESQLYNGGFEKTH